MLKDQGKGIAFARRSLAMDPVMGAPAPAAEDQLRELHIRISREKEPWHPFS